MADIAKTSLSPMLSVRHGAKAVEFYKAGFGAGELFRIEAPDGAVVRPAVGGGSGILGGGRVSGAQEFQPESLGAESCQF